MPDVGVDPAAISNVSNSVTYWALYIGKPLMYFLIMIFILYVAFVFLKGVADK